MKGYFLPRGLMVKALYICAFAVLSYVYMRVAMRVPVNSDGAAALLIARDIAEGNVFLQGWSLSTVSFYFTELVPFAVAIKLVGWHTGLFYLVPGMMLATAVLLSFHLCAQTRPEANWPLLVVIATPGFFAANLLLVPCIHMGAYIAGLFSWALVRRYRENGALWVLVLLWLVLSAVLFSDDIARYFLLAPLCLASAWTAYKQGSRRDLLLLACAVGAVIGSKLLGLVFSHFNGFRLPGLNEVTFASYDSLGQNLNLAVQGTFMFFEADFFGRPVISIQGVLTAARAAVVVGLVVAFVRVAKRLVALNYYELAWLLSALIMLSAYVGSNLPVNVMTTRYLVPVFIFGSLLVASAYPITGRVRRWFVLLAVGYFGVFLFQIDSRPVIAEQVSPIAAELDKRKLDSGYATFWNANANAFISGTKIAPVSVDGAVVPRRWLSKEQWYDGVGTFLILDTPQEVDIAQAQLGNADELLIVDGKYLLIWTKGFSLAQTG